MYLMMRYFASNKMMIGYSFCCLLFWWFEVALLCEDFCVFYKLVIITFIWLLLKSLTIF